MLVGTRGPRRIHDLPLRQEKRTEVKIQKPQSAVTSWLRYGRTGWEKQEKKIEVMQDEPETNNKKMRNSHYTHGCLIHITQMTLLAAHCNRPITTLGRFRGPSLEKETKNCTEKHEYQCQIDSAHLQDQPKCKLDLAS